MCPAHGREQGSPPPAAMAPRRGQPRPGNLAVAGVASAVRRRRVVGRPRAGAATARRIDPDFAGEQIADPAVSRPAPRPASRGVQRQHELAMQPFPQRCSSGPRSSSAVSASCRPAPGRPRSGLQGGQPMVFQAHGLRMNERIVGQVGEHLAPPQTQRLA